MSESAFRVPARGARVVVVLLASFVATSVVEAHPTAWRSTLLAALFAAPSSPQAVRTVNAADDVDNGACATHCSLREAIKYSAAGDTIVFSNLFDIARTIKLTGALPAITKNLTITGPARERLEVRRDSGGDYSVFAISGGASVAISSMTISNGKASSGGGILNDASTLTLTDVAVTENQASFAGAGIANVNGATLHENNSLVNLNVSAGYGGGIYNYVSTLTVSNSLIDRNVTYDGGGIYTEGGVADVSGTSLTRNDATNGGGLYAGTAGIDSLSGLTVTLTNTTLSANTASANGSAIYHLNDRVPFISHLDMINCTVAANAGSAFAAYATVGVADFGSTAFFSFRNTIFANFNTVNLTASGQIYPYSGGGNLATDDGSGLLNGPGDKLNTDPKLASLANYGGPTPTQILLPGSPALEGGTNDYAPATDQRGVARPYNGTVDVGAVEMKPYIVTTADDPGDGICDFSCALRDAIITANAGGSALADIQFNAFFDTPRTINLASALPVLTGHVNIVGPGAKLLTVRRNTGGNYSVFSTNTIAEANLSGMTISNGNVTGFGGGINNPGKVALAGVVVDGNTATSGGGGIYNYNHGTLTIDDSTLSNNVADDGAALYNEASSARLTNTTISGNNANSHSSGGITNLSYGAGPSTVTLLNATISNNASGSIYEAVFAGTDAVTRVTNTITAGNSPIHNYTGQSLTSIVSFGHNLADDDGAGFLTAAGDIVSLNAKLAPLADNGGPTKTHALLTGSPASNAADALLAPPFDQRGVARIGTAPDIGAFESDVLFRNSFEAPN